LHGVGRGTGGHMHGSIVTHLVLGSLQGTWRGRHFFSGGGISQSSQPTIFERKSLAIPFK